MPKLSVQPPLKQALAHILLSFVKHCCYLLNFKIFNFFNYGYVSGLSVIILSFCLLYVTVSESGCVFSSKSLLGYALLFAVLKEKKNAINTLSGI